MKKFLLLLIILLCATSVRAEDDIFDFDFKFLNDPFAGQKMVTEKEFEQALGKTTPQKKKKEPSKFAKWFWGAKDSRGQQGPPPEYFGDMPNELGVNKSIVSTKPVLTLGARVQDNSGIVLASGHYQVDLKNIEGQNYIVFLQAHQTTGKFKASPCEDNYDKPAVIYARMVDMQDGWLKVIFSNLDGTFQGFARIVD